MSRRAVLPPSRPPTTGGTGAAQGSLRDRQGRRDRAPRRAYDTAYDDVDTCSRRSDAHAQAAAPSRRDQPPRRQGRACRLHARAAQSPLQPRPHQARRRSRERQEAARLEPRPAAAAAQPDRGGPHAARVVTPKPPYALRRALPEDIAAVAAIYAHHVATGTASFELEPPTLDETARRYSSLTASGYPYIAA